MQHIEDQAALRAELTRDEGRRSHLYRCSEKKLTIGVGWNIEDNGLPDHIIDALLDHAIRETERELTERLPWWIGLSERRKRALLNMAFNLGVPRLLGFRKMLSALRAGDYQGAAREALDSRWANQVGDRAQRIAAIFREG